MQKDDEYIKKTKEKFNEWKKERTNEWMNEFNGKLHKNV